MGSTINGRYVYQWELDGKRRPFPGLAAAAKAYGAENVYFDKPRYVEEGHCAWCGMALGHGRRKVYCDDMCSKNFARLTVWQRGCDPYSLRICYRDNFTCQDCGEFHAYKNKHGVYIPIDDGCLEVHHILPVSEGGGDEPSNLVTLCKACHRKRHAAQREEGQA